MGISSHSLLVSLELKNTHPCSLLRVLDANVHVDVSQRVQDIYGLSTKNSSGGAHRTSFSESSRLVTPSTVP